MKDKTILGSWCTEPNCKFIDSKHIQTELVAHIWYSYDNDSKTDVINKKLCFVKEIDFDDLNDTAEIIEEKPTQEEIKEYTNKFLEVWIPVKKQYGKLFDEIARIGNILDLEDELEEQKKIPEKLNITYEKNCKNNYKWKCEGYNISTPQKLIADKINEIIDYLKSKGE